MKKTLTLTILSVLLLANGAWAAPYTTAVTNDVFSGISNGIPTPNSNTGEFEIYNSVNLLLGTSYTNNAQIDYLEVTGDKSSWLSTGNGGYALIGIGAGNSNVLEVYNTTTPGTKVNVFGFGVSGNGHIGDGSIGSPFYGTGDVFAAGTNFGFALKSGGNTWYSDPTLNSDGMDHIMAYNLSSLAGHQIYIYDPNSHTEQLVTLKNPYLISFEDLSLANNGAHSDQDYNDYTFIYDRAVPVPEPSTWALFAVGLLSAVFFGLRRKLAV